MDIDVTVVILMLNKACMKGINQLSIHKMFTESWSIFCYWHGLPFANNYRQNGGSFSLQSYTIHID